MTPPPEGRRLGGGAAGAPRPRPPVVYYVFAIPHYNGRDLMPRPLEERRRILEAVLPTGAVVRLSESFPGDGKAFYRAAQDHRLEGIVGKRRTSAYEPGKRSGAWVKVKVRKTLHAVVGGHTQGRRGRSRHFGALLLGLYDGKRQLQYIGHVGGGFSDQDLREILGMLRPLERKTPPFATEPRSNEPATWTEARIVVQVEDLEWTGEGVLRFPVFKGLAPEVAPQTCRLEEVRPPQIPDEQPMPKAPASRLTVAARAGTEAGGRTANNLSPLERELARLRLPVEFTNLDKIYWPELGLTKGGLVAYYLVVHTNILHHPHTPPLT